MPYREFQGEIVLAGVRRATGYCGYESWVKTAKTIADSGKERCRMYVTKAFRLVEAAE